MKFHFFKDAAGEWRWNAQAGGNIIFSAGEGFEKAQKAVSTVRKNIVREDVKLEAALVKALKEVGLTDKGAIVKGWVEPVKAVKPVKKAKLLVEKVKTAVEKALD